MRAVSVQIFEITNILSNDTHVLWVDLILCEKTSDEL